MLMEMGELVNGCHRAIAQAGEWAIIRDRLIDQGARMSLINLLTQEREVILQIAARYGASDVRVFGSAAREDATADSDIDLLVRMEHGRSLFDLAALTHELEDLLGRRVDVVPDDSIYWLLQSRILEEARPI